MEKLKIFCLLLSFCAVIGCSEKSNFSYEVLDPRINIDNLPFGKNKDFDEDKMYPIEYVKTGEKIQTSVYLFAAAGSCAANTIDPFIQERSDSLILSFKLRKRNVSNACPIMNLLKLNYLIATKRDMKVFFALPEINFDKM